MVLDDLGGFRMIFMGGLTQFAYHVLPKAQAFFPKLPHPSCNKNNRKGAQNVEILG